MKAIQSASIPITFTCSAYDEPWDDEIDYDTIRVDIDPDDVANLQQRPEEIVNEEGRIEEMQRAIIAVQVGRGQVGQC